MHYEQMKPAIFLDRPNRFIAHIEIDGKIEICHVKNTGRCKELLPPGARIWVQENLAPTRSTHYDLITVQKGDRMINMDAVAPNKVFEEWARAGGFIPNPTYLKAESIHGDSRFDFYYEAFDRRGYVEIKGVTLEDRGIVRFPDAPTERGVKHLHGLIECVHEGLEAWAVFVIQMKDVQYLEPNRATHPAFSDAMAEAKAAGVHLLALDTQVTPDSITIRREVPIHI